MAKRTTLATFIFFACSTITTEQLYAQNQEGTDTGGALLNKQSENADKKQEYLERKAKEGEQRKIELEVALMRARLERELVDLRAEIERLRLEREATALKWEIEQDKSQKEHEKQMVELNHQREKLAAELAISQAKVDKNLEQFNANTLELYNNVKLLKVEAEQLAAEIEHNKVRTERAKYADSEPIYLKEPLQKDGSLVISDRCIQLDGIITPWKASYIADRIQYFNNKDRSKPIFIVIGNSPGGSVMAGSCILKAMQNSEAPVHVVVTAFAASMSALITTLADKSYAYPNAIILHHQPWTFTSGNVRELKEKQEFLQEWWNRLGGEVAKKMGVSLKKLDQLLYEKSAQGDWLEFGDKAAKVKWVDCVINGIKDSNLREMPDSANYTWEKFWKEYYGARESITPTDDTVVYLPPLGPKDFYFLYNPNNQYQLRSRN